MLQIESELWKEYYNNIDKILNYFYFGTRSRRPPQNEINSLISFGNSLLYATCLTEIYNTYLNPAISYLHEPSERRFSLALDLADIFKPLLVGRTIFHLVNKNMIDTSCFINEDKCVFLNNKGKRIFIKVFDEKLNTTIYHPKLKRNITYRRLIRLECYKLIKHVLGDKKYESFKIWW